MRELASLMNFEKSPFEDVIPRLSVKTLRAMITPDI
jgi:hypothetical protein